ncbi:Cd(II)/Pb(II)-responsive transcriptional regulator [Alkalimarinus coralli]|uniref:Cd(II)/Pb(II)-responsive transcriptional regulator n=1 Tax=Alkalimarinus coralli TaxID=2935863 RepID=UPI00202AC5E9|nr:Cd(II)/Pb(II)-responsive transcriptional regulator [Alkalimarinus coralli]
MRISQLAKAAHCDLETVRYYEKIKLMPAPPRNESGYRIYNQHHLERLNFIRHCRSLDMPLKEITSLLHFRDHPTLKCDQVNQLIDQQLDSVANKIEMLEGLKEQLNSLRSRCDSDHAAGDCGILKELDSDAEAGSCPCHEGTSGPTRIGQNNESEHQVC